jgi:transcriptional regulator with XRE-family HTH domain
MEDILSMETKLRMLRISHNWSQEQVADKIEISQAAYAKLEVGKTRLTIDRARQLANLYKIEPEYFFSNELRPSINHNNGTNSHSNAIYNPENYTDIVYSTGKEIFEKFLNEKDKLINAKDELIKMLTDTLNEARKERDQLLKLIEKITNKS